MEVSRSQLVLLTLCLASSSAVQVRGDSVTLNYTENGEILFSLNVPVTGCHASFGAFPHWCLGNISACATSGFSLGVWFKLQPSDVTQSEVVLLTNGGTTPNSDGIYVIRRYGDQFEVGVAIGGNIWRETFRLWTNGVTWNHLTIAWQEKAGLSVGVDGVVWLRAVTTSLRSSVTRTDPHEIEIGLDAFGPAMTSSCSSLVQHVQMFDSASYANSFSQQTDFNNNFLKGCSSTFFVTDDALVEISSYPNPVTACREKCSEAKRTLALVRNKIHCTCLESISDAVTSPSACRAKDWHLYQVHHMTNQSSLKLRAWSAMTTGRGYTKPGEGVAFYATHDLNLKSSFTFSFDDGTTLVTSSTPVYHEFKTAGEHKVTVTTQVGIIGLNSTLSVLIEDVDEGVKPNMVRVTSWHEEEAKNALHHLFVADEHSTSCSLSYGDGTLLNLPTFTEFGQSQELRHQYLICGGYSVAAECNNKYGQTTARTFFWAREVETFYSYLPLRQDFNISVAGQIAVLQSLVLEVSGDPVVFSVGTNHVTIDGKEFTHAMDNLVEVKSPEGIVLTRHVIRSLRHVSQSVIKVDKAVDAWNLRVNVTVTVMPCDFALLAVDMGQGELPVLLYVQEVTVPVIFWKMVEYDDLGAYLIVATVSNEISSASSSMWVSVEAPIASLNAMTFNITALTSPVLVTLDVNGGAPGPDRVVFAVDYDDGHEPQKLFHNNNQREFQSLTLDYFYEAWGIYTITVTAYNNISSVTEHILIQVGQNITFVDLVTSTERVSLGENVTFHVVCPTGSDVTYTLNFGDGTRFSADEVDAITDSPLSVAYITSPRTATFKHLYATPGYYKVSLTASNVFGVMSTTLCPTVVVSSSEVTAAHCASPTVLPPYGNSSLSRPATNKRSYETRVQVQASVNCPQNVTKMTYSWKTALIDVNERGEVTETTVHSVCRFHDRNSTLVLPPRALAYGLYKLTVIVSPVGYDIVATTHDLYLQVEMSQPLSIIEGPEVTNVMLYATAIFDISQSQDPDLDSDVRKDLSFHMFCMPEAELKKAVTLNLDSILEVSTAVGNKTMFRTTSMNDFWLYEYAMCFKDHVVLMQDLTAYNGKVSFPASYFTADHFSFGIILWTERAGLTNMTSQIIEVRTSNMSLDDLGSLLDLALTADPDTAIRLIGGAADAILNVDSSSVEEQEKLAESAEAVVNTLGSVAKRVDNANQATKCAGTIKTMTSNSDIVTQGSRASAASAFRNLANGTRSMAETTVDDATSFAGETLGGLNNIFPATVTEVKRSPREMAATTTVQPESTTVAEIMAARNITSDDYSTPAFDAWTTSAAFTTASSTSTTSTTTVTIPPRSHSGSISFDGSNYNIGGITISTLATTLATTSSSTSTTTTSTAPTVSTEPPISEWMLAPGDDTSLPYEAAATKLRALPEDPTYDELFTYIFDDCVLFRKVMKESEVQTKCPCVTSSDINVMTCEGKISRQERVFEAMTRLEHPDDIYDVYIKPLSAESQKRAELKRSTDAQVAEAGNSALETVADTVNDKTDKDDNTERVFQTSRFGMRLQKFVVNGTNSTDEGAKQAMSTDVGSFNMPASVLSALSHCSNLNTMFLGDSDNPYTFSTEKSSVGKGVITLGYSCAGEKIAVVNTAEPLEMWIKRDPRQYKPGLFVLLTDVTDHEAQFNYHPVNLTDKNSSLQVVIRAGGENEAYDVYVQYDVRPNLTHHDYVDSVPKIDLSHLAHHHSLESLAPEIQEELLYTVTVPFNLTAKNGTYWIGVKLKKGTVSLDDSISNTSYTLLNLPSGCRYWDEVNSTWSSQGCVVGELTSRWKVQCLCTHLTSFGSDAVVPPNTIDFTNVWAKFAKLNENAAVFSTVICFVCLYVILLIWLRYKDKQDLIKWGARPLEDNLPSDNYYYQLAIYTGVRKNAGTDSSIRFILSGEQADSGVRKLFDGKRKHFGRGSIYNFVLSAEQTLGSLTFLRIWHDNGGKGKHKSWYLDQMQVTDLQTGEKSYFLCDRWLAVEEDDGMVDRIIPVAGLEDLIAFKHLFSSSARKKLANDHLWFSVFSRPTRSNFTRVQRLSCCMSLLFLTMITNAMFFRTEEQQTTTTAIRLGPFKFTLAQVFISFVSTVIVFPPSFFLVLFFRRCRQKKNAVMQTNQQLHKRNQKYRWRNLTNTPATWGNKMKKTRTQKLKESVSNIVHSQRVNKYQESEELPHGRNYVTKKKRKKKPWSLPHWCIYIAWFVCFLSIVVSGFFTILYSMEWGAEKANEWLVTFILSFFQSVVVLQPVKVLLMVAFISCILRKPDLDEEDLHEDLEKVMSPEDLIVAKDKDPVSLSDVQLERQMGSSSYAPPDIIELQTERENRLKEIKMEAVLKEIIIYFFFLLIIFFISYQQRDPVSYNFGVNIRNIFLGDFESIQTVTDYWTWLEETFLPALFATTYANGTEIKFWKDRACISDLETRRVGVARIRQLRVKNDSCTIRSEMKSVINHCRDAYSWTDDDAKDYLPRWGIPTEAEREELKDQKTPWVYQNSVKLRNAPYVGTLTTYKGGGYVLLTKRDLCRTKQVIEDAKSNVWLDLNTRAIFLEFTVYNPNVNLFASSVLLTEFVNTGGATARVDIKIFRLLSYVGGWGLVVLLFEITYAFFTVYFFIRCIRMLKNERLRYFKGFWNILEFVLLCFAVACIVLYSMKHALTEVAMRAVKNRESDGFVNFQSVALYDEIYGYLMSAVVFMATIQFLKLLQFNQKMGMLGDTVQLAAKDLKVSVIQAVQFFHVASSVFSVAFLLYFTSFVIAGYLLFGQTISHYNNIVGATEAMFAFALGSFDFIEMETAQPILGPIFFFTYIMVVYVGLMSIFLTIIGDALTQVKEDVALRSNEYELVEFMWTRFKSLLGWK